MFPAKYNTHTGNDEDPRPREQDNGRHKTAQHKTAQ